MGTTPRTRCHLQERISFIATLMLHVPKAQKVETRPKGKRFFFFVVVDSLLLALAVLEQPAVAAPGEDLVPDPEVGVRRPLRRVVVLHVGEAVDAEPGARGDG